MLTDYRLTPIRRVIKFLKGNIGENHELAVGRDFLHREAQTIEEKVDQMTS